MLKTALVIGGIVIAIVTVVPAIFGAIYGWQGYGYGMMGPGMMRGFAGFGGGWLVPIVMIVFWGLVIWGIVALVRGVAPGCGSGQTDSALDVLKRRYARGEISKEEFEGKKRDLV